MRVVIADDALLIRSALGTLLREAGIEVVGQESSAAGLIERVDATTPDAVVVDIRMPPSHTDEGIVAAHRIRRDHPRVGVLLLSQYLDSAYALRLIEDNPEGMGYLLKERITHANTLVDALHRVVVGECVVDPAIVARLLNRSRRPDPVAALTAREREVLALMAQGQSNAAICDRLSVSAKTVETHVSRVFSKLGLAEETRGHRRVLAVLTYLRRGAP